jgi:hypothetical protein
MSKLSSIFSPFIYTYFTFIVLKYIGYYAELPLGLPKTIEDKIIEDLQKLPCGQGMPHHFINVTHHM